MKSKFKVSFEVEIEFDEDEMTEQQAIEEITGSMFFPCEDTDNVSIVQQTVVEMPEEEFGDITAFYAFDNNLDD